VDSKRTFKIVEKVYSILKRFVLFASQNKHISERLLTAFIIPKENNDAKMNKRIAISPASKAK
jgi:hypothetical protein